MGMTKDTTDIQHLSKSQANLGYEAWNIWSERSNFWGKKKDLIETDLCLCKFLTESLTPEVFIKSLATGQIFVCVYIRA